MNKKLFVGISMVTAVSAGFWACGEGSINEMTEMDNVISMQYPLDPATGAAGPELENLKNDALSSCKEDIGCFTQYQGYLNGEEPVDVPESSSAEENQGPYTNPTMSSSSRGDINIVTKPSSSSVTIIDNPDPDPTSSAGIDITPITGLGSCAPASTPINKGTSVKWKFSGNLNAGYKAMDFAKATFAWSFEGGMPATDGTPSTSAAITYPNSGPANASLMITMADGKSETIQCSPLQVNGDPITGCKCAPVGVTGSVDFTATPDVTWSVAGCTSASDIISYTWEGTAGETSFTKTFTAEAKSYAPTLKVGNADNTVIDVACDPVKVTEGAEYTIKAPNDAGTIKLPAGSSLVVLAADGYNNTFFCKVERSDSPTGALTITVNEESLGGGDYVALKLTKTQLKSGTSLSVTLDYTATCGIQ